MLVERKSKKQEHYLQQAGRSIAQQNKQKTKKRIKHMTTPTQTTPPTPTLKLVKALTVIAQNLMRSSNGDEAGSGGIVFAAALLEAADRLEELHHAVEEAFDIVVMAKDDPGPLSVAFDKRNLWNRE